MLVIAAAGFLSACGGGDGPSSPPQSAPPPPPAAQPGTTYDCAPRAAAVSAILGGTRSSGGVDSSFVLFANASGRHVFVYGGEGGSSFAVLGMSALYAADCAGSDGTRLNGWDWYGRVFQEVWVQATYDIAAPAVSGSIQSRTGTVLATFSGGAIPGASYDHNTAATVQASVGDWVSPGALAGGDADLMSIRPDGSVTVRAYNGTHLTGTVVPDPSGKNVLTLTLDSSPLGLCCLDIFTGQVVTYAHASGGDRLVAWAVAYDAVGEPYTLSMMASRP